MTKTEDKNDTIIPIPTLAQSHYFLFNKDFDQTSCGEAMTFILERNFMTKHKPEAIRMIINSDGGELQSAFALIDVMEASRIPVFTYGLGRICSAGLITFMAGEAGNRYVTRNTSILSHQYSWGNAGKEHELFATIKEIDLTRKRMMDHYKRYTKQTEKVITQYLLPPEDVWLSAREALKYGIADKIIDAI